MLLIQIPRRIRRSDELRATLQHDQRVHRIAHALCDTVRDTWEPEDEVGDRVHVEQQHLPDVAVDTGFGLGVGGAAEGERGGRWGSDGGE